VEKRFCQPIARLEQTINHLRIKRIPHDQKTVLVKRLSLRRLKLNEVQLRCPSDFAL
jgi:limonene-1,2-epoxide hydrolase